MRYLYGADHPGYSGDNAGYIVRHERVYKARGSAEGPCSDCGTEVAGRFEWAQVHGTDGLDPFADYVSLCHPCHDWYDRSERECKVTEKQVLEIRALDGWSQRAIGRVYGLDQTYVGDILNNKVWKRAGEHLRWMEELV